jgi:hypothetical protein
MLAYGNYGLWNHAVTMTIFAKKIEIKFYLTNCFTNRPQKKIEEILTLQPSMQLFGCKLVYP